MACAQINLNVPTKNPDGFGMEARGIFPFGEIALWNVAAGATGPEQMALDEVMLRLATLPTLRFYRWKRKEVTFGYPQRWEDAKKFANGRPITRRSTGGGFVEHGADLTIALAVPAAHPFARLAPTETYRRIHEAMRAALGGETARLATAEDCACGPACFASPARHDVLRGGQKILGGAQRRSREGLLYQGSVQGATIDNPAAFFAAGIEAWEPKGWRELRNELKATRYGNAAWNERR